MAATTRPPGSITSRVWIARGQGKEGEEWKLSVFLQVENDLDLLHILASYLLLLMSETLKIKYFKCKLSYIRMKVQIIVKSTWIRIGVYFGYLLLQNKIQLVLTEGETLLQFYGDLRNYCSPLIKCSPGRAPPESGTGVPAPGREPLPLNCWQEGPSCSWVQWADRLSRNFPYLEQWLATHGDKR